MTAGDWTLAQRDADALRVSLEHDEAVLRRLAADPVLAAPSAGDRMGRSLSAVRATAARVAALLDTWRTAMTEIDRLLTQRRTAAQFARITELLYGDAVRLGPTARRKADGRHPGELTPETRFRLVEIAKEVEGELRDLERAVERASLVQNAAARSVAVLRAAQDAISEAKSRGEGSQVEDAVDAALESVGPGGVEGLRGRVARAEAAARTDPLGLSPLELADLEEILARVRIAQLGVAIDRLGAEEIDASGGVPRAHGEAASLRGMLRRIEDRCARERTTDPDDFAALETAIRAASERARRARRPAAVREQATESPRCSRPDCQGTIEGDGTCDTCFLAPDGRGNDRLR